jgi:cytochrome c-type biogenesis protein
MFAQEVSFTAAFGAGLLSFLSPCILPLIPAYFSFITGMSLEDLTREGDHAVRRKLILATVSYVLGFSAVFIALGGAVSLMGHQMEEYKDFIRLTGGAVVIIFGVHLSGVLRIPIFDYEKKFHVKGKPLHILGVFLVGMAFGAGWSPCIGPLLGSILALAAGEGSVSHGMALLSIYSLGMALPFILMSVFINYMLSFIRKAGPWIRFATVTAGVLLIVMGLVLIFNKMNVLTPY